LDRRDVEPTACDSRCRDDRGGAGGEQARLLSELMNVRFYPKSDRLLRCREMTLCAISDQSTLQQIGEADSQLMRNWMQT
jgi:hypothetical protein